ncbi:MAG: hypothetical protein N3D12_06695, partial [Candidatus Methanomethyliaceae archaeon]|nr:hypothetical protein [Candidatus Methanomethyliaceae archaeon]
LDAYLFSRRRVPTAEDLNVRFGPGSLVYENVIEGLMELFKEIKEPIKFELWKRNMELVYGRNSSRPPWRRLNLFRSGSTPAFSRSRSPA